MGQLQPQGHAGDCAHVGGDLLAPLAVPPGGSPHQQAVLVAQGQGVAIDLELPHHLQGRQGGARVSLAVEHLEQAAIPGLQVFEAEGVIKAEQADAVLHAGEALRRGAAHPLGGAVRRHQAWVGGLEIEQLAVELVVNRIVELGGIEHVVGMGGPAQQPP